MLLKKFLSNIGAELISVSSYNYFDLLNERFSHHDSLFPCACAMCIGRIDLDVTVAGCKILSFFERVYCYTADHRFWYIATSDYWFHTICGSWL